MKIIEKSKSNNVDVYLAKTKLQDNIIGQLLSSATPYSPSPEFEGLMRLLEGTVVDVSIFSSTNVVGRTTEKDILAAWENIPDIDKKMYWQLDENGNSKILENVIDKFGDGKLGFQAKIKPYPSDVLKSINDYNEELLYQGLDIILNSHFSIEEGLTNITVKTYETNFETYERDAFNEILQNDMTFEPIEFSFDKTKHKLIFQILTTIADHQDNEIASDNIIDYPLPTDKEIAKSIYARKALIEIINEHTMPTKKNNSNTM